MQVLHTLILQKKISVFLVFLEKYLFCNLFLCNTWTAVYWDKICLFIWECPIQFLHSNFFGKTLHASISIFIFNNGNTRTICKVCSKLTIKSIERRQWHRSGTFNRWFCEDITCCCDVSVADYEQKNVNWIMCKLGYCN